ncbi:MAG: hypothetical protein ACT4OJ_11050 [Bacteroidota bacterium]
MRTATLIAIISMAFQTFGSIYYLLTSLHVITYSQTVNEIMQPLYLLSNAGLLVFFIILYQKQTKN